MIILAFQAHAIAFIPPVIYFATLSIIGFISNVFLILAVWLAVKGIANKLYFGKPLHTIVSIALSWLGTALIILLSSLLPLLVLHPIITKEIIISSIVSGFLCFFFLLLNIYRQFRRANLKEKTKSVRKMTIISILVIIISFVSASLSIETMALQTNSKGAKLAVLKPELSLPSFGLDMASEMAAAAPAPVNFQRGVSLASNKQIDTLWVYPVNSDACLVYFDWQLILDQYPEMKCYYFTENNRKERINCPIPLKIDLFRKMANSKQEGLINAKGSCNDTFYVNIGDAGFTLE